jgi:hypothetical protein
MESRKGAWNPPGGARDGPKPPSMYRPQPVASQSKPSAPPVYRPQPVASQPKLSAPSVYRTQPGASQPRLPAPSVYHPRPIASQPKLMPGIAYAPNIPTVRGRGNDAFAMGRSGISRPAPRCGSQPVVPRCVQRAQSPFWLTTPGSSYSFNAQSAHEATQPGQYAAATSRTWHSGVSEGEVGSYGVAQYVGAPGDQLTPDHQPSGAAVKEALRQALHQAKTTVLTRLQARNAYQKAVTVMVAQAWHQASSRTYGGRNNSLQIQNDALGLFDGAVEDFGALADYWLSIGWTQQEISDVWDALHAARNAFFSTGHTQSGTLQ